jgi:hypothetical protein
MLYKLKSGILILVLMLGVLLALRASDLYQSACFNLASLALSHWSSELQLPKARNHLSKAMYWGEKSGSEWVQRGYDTRVRALWSRVTDEQVESRQRAEEAYQRGQILEQQENLGQP